ncbi:MAG: response regulator [Acidobacteria bacterium]|nr:MAG: response regulator [Acidobacteriota bacterium]REK11292.1 MAG: response regulator [Acidobacteriota bacterium]
MSPRNANMIDILLVEDNPGDIELARESLADSKIINHLDVVTDGEQALAYLRRQPPYEEAEPPDLVILDLNLPRKDGREVLQEIKQDPKLRRLPVVVLTSSSEERDVLAAYDLHANCYVQKPLNLDCFIEVVRSIEGFWMSIVSLPSKA